MTTSHSEQKPVYFLIRGPSSSTVLGCCACALLLLIVGEARAYQFNDGDRWGRTATDGTGMVQGDPTTLTWGFVPDGTTVVGAAGEPNSPSDLIATLDSLYGASLVDGNLTQRPWFPLFADSLGRWGELSGLTYIYEPNDPGAPLNGSARGYPFGTRGQLGVAPDVRIGGHSIDGQSGSNILAYNYYPDTGRNNSGSGDMVIDTDNTTFFGDMTNTSLGLRNVVTHEAGHGIGIDHVDSNDASLLMEPFINLSFDGPQLDDILAVQRGYGDAWEKNGGNDSSAKATPLGTLLQGDPLAIGTDADDVFVAPDDVDFVSIDDNSDIDFFSFTTTVAGSLDVTLTPKGPTYNQGPEGGPQSPLNTSTLSNLTLALFDTDGTSNLLSVNNNPAGGTESIVDYILDSPGTYFVRITGAANNVQLYQLDLSFQSALVLGDMNGDTFVNSLDVPLFIQALVNRAAYDGLGYPVDADVSGDVNEDGRFDLGDIDLLNTLVSASASAASVPEPASLALLGIGWIAFARFGGRRLTQHRST